MDEKQLITLPKNKLIVCIFDDKMEIRSNKTGGADVIELTDEYTGFIINDKRTKLDPHDSFRAGANRIVIPQ